MNSGNLNITNAASDKLLWINMILLGAVLASQYYVNQDMQRVERELRITSLQLQDQTAVLLRAGIIQPGDLINGPTAPTNK